MLFRSIIIHGDYSHGPLLKISAGFSTVRGLALHGAGSDNGGVADGIQLTGGGSNIVTACYFGLDPDGMITPGNPRGGHMKSALPRREVKHPETLELLELFPTAVYSRAMVGHSLLHGEEYGLNYKCEVFLQCRGNIMASGPDPEIMAEALDMGADIINDIHGFSRPGAIEAVAAFPGAGLCVMHMQGTPQTMQSAPSYLAKIPMPSMDLLIPEFNPRTPIKKIT